MTKSINKILKLKPIAPIIEATRHIHPPGLEEMSLHDVGVFFFVEMGKSAINTRAASVAFKFFLALFPAIIFLFTLIPYLPIDDLYNQLLTEMKSVLPHNAYDAAVETIHDLVKNQHGGLLSFGFLVTLYFSTNGIDALMQAFNHSFHASETRPFLKQRLISLLLFIILSFLLITATTLIIGSEAAIGYFIKKGFLSGGLDVLLLTIGKWAIVLMLFFTAISILYYFGPVKKMKYKFISAGATLATVLAILASLGFSYYVNNFGTYNKVYGSIGTIMVVMLWLEFNSMIVLIGFDLNVKIARLEINQKK